MIIQPAMDITSAKAVEKILRRCSSEIDRLPIGSLESLREPVNLDNNHMCLNKYKLCLISNDLLTLQLVLNKFKKKKEFTRLSEELQAAINLTDEKRYVNSVLIKRHEKDENGLEEEQILAKKGPQETISNVIVEDNDLSSLRKRLLSNDRGTSLLDSTKDLNNYHNSFQDDLIDDLADLSKSLKSSAKNFSTKLFEDSKVVEDTERNFSKNSNYMTTIGGNLNNYLLNKTGNKIGIFWLLKVFGIIFLCFIFIVIIIKIIPSF
ncbi:uncharacterized protein PRCAT00000184001 [Priceomyces carsonii]|uniref:uncharacterized protein n=1 Tax=Priceomyces carsonii TaxID=28549 RepID=UPI002EDA9EC9|nr:unnamed protein product [Priceomyces carsonii]